LKAKDDFWAPLTKQNQVVTIPIALEQCKKKLIVYSGEYTINKAKKEYLFYNPAKCLF